MCTKMPIEIRMKRVSGKENEYATIDHPDCGKTKYEFENLGTTITELQNKILGERWLESEALVINIFSETCPHNLTVVDLPGLIQSKNKKQPEGFPEQIKDLVTKWISKPETLILCVAAGNIDFSNSPIEEALKVDPKGDRTIGVVTKMDLCVQGDDEEKLRKHIVEQPDFFLKYGWVGVINRTAQQIKDGMTMKKSKEYE